MAKSAKIYWPAKKICSHNKSVILMLEGEPIRHWGNHCVGSLSPKSMISGKLWLAQPHACGLSPLTFHRSKCSNSRDLSLGPGKLVNSILPIIPQSLAYASMWWSIFLVENQSSHIFSGSASYTLSYQSLFRRNQSEKILRFFTSQDGHFPTVNASSRI